MSTPGVKKSYIFLTVSLLVNNVELWNFSGLDLVLFSTLCHVLNKITETKPKMKRWSLIFIHLLINKL